MGSDRLVDSFEAARVLGYHNIEERPPGGVHRNENAEYRRQYYRFKKAVERGQVPKADKTIGLHGDRWWLKRLLAWVGEHAPPEQRGRGRPKKKPDSRLPRESGRNTSPHGNEDKAVKRLPRRTLNVNDSVRHED